MFSYAFCKAYAERHGLTLHTDPWQGQKIFDIQDPVIPEGYPMRNEFDLVDGERDFVFRSYAQQQKCMIYTKADAQRFFRFRPWIETDLKELLPTYDFVVGHRRVGDYAGYGYPVVSSRSYVAACATHGIPTDLLRMVTEENPFTHQAYRGELACVPDFFRLVQAPILLRGNSTFSWWAGTLGNGKVYSPVIEDLEGGKEHDVPFVEGNHSRFANLHFITDLRLPA